MGQLHGDTLYFDRILDVKKPNTFTAFYKGLSLAAVIDLIILVIGYLCFFKHSEILGIVLDLVELIVFCHFLYIPIGIISTFAFYVALRFMRPVSYKIIYAFISTYAFAASYFILWCLSEYVEKTSKVSIETYMFMTEQGRVHISLVASVFYIICWFFILRRVETSLDEPIQRIFQSNN